MTKEFNPSEFNSANNTNHIFCEKYLMLEKQLARFEDELLDLQTKNEIVTIENTTYKHALQTIADECTSCEDDNVCGVDGLETSISCCKKDDCLIYLAKKALW